MGRVVLTPNSLRNIIRELDATATSVKITLTQEHVVFNTDGDLGKTRVGFLLGACPSSTA